MTKTSLPKPTIIKKIVKENFKTKTYITDTRIKAKPGQFITVWLPKQAERPFSVTFNNPLSFTVTSVGFFTKYLNSNLIVGDKIWYRGPIGKGIFKESKGKKILVSGGCGCVPLYFLAKTIKNKKSTQIIIGAKTKKELLFVSRFRKLGYNVFISTDDGTVGFKGFTTNLLKKLLGKQKVSCVYACGPNLMLKKIANICKKNKVKYQLSLEAIVKCGFGVCGSCAKGEKLICKDGPVFSKWLDNE